MWKPRSLHIRSRRYISDEDYDGSDDGDQQLYPFSGGGGGGDADDANTDGGVWCYSQTAVRAFCCLVNACLMAAGLLVVCAALVLQFRPPAASSQLLSTCCCAPLLPLTGASLPAICLAAACLPLVAGLLGLAATAHRRARLGHAASAVATTCCALLVANLGILACADGDAADLSSLLSACGLLAQRQLRGNVIARLVLSVCCISAVILLCHAFLSWTYYYKYSSSGGYDGHYSLAEVRDRLWRQRLQRRRRLLQQQQLLLMRPSDTDAGRGRRGRGVWGTRRQTALENCTGPPRFEMLTV